MDVVSWSGCSDASVSRSVVGQLPPTLYSPWLKLMVDSSLSRILLILRDLVIEHGQ